MRILFDFRIYQFAYNRGIGRYIYDLVNHMIKNDINNNLDISIFLRKDVGNFPKFDEKYNLKYYFYEDLKKYNFEKSFDFWFFDDFLCTQKLTDINNFFDILFPKKLRDNSKKIVGITHDLIPLVFAKNYLSEDIIIKKLYLIQLETLKIVDYFFANSDFTKNEYIKYLKIDKNKIMNIYGSSDLEKFKGINSNQEYSYTNRNNNIICIPASDERKNPQGLIKGFGVAYNNKKIPQDAKLYICCKLYKKFKKFLQEEIKNASLTEEQVILTDFISDEELIKLLSNAKANFFPSFYEGLGLPIIEAYACGTPSFASNRSSTKELVLPECSFDPYNENDIADKIIKAYNNEELCKKSLDFGEKLIKEKLNWNIIASKVINKLFELNEYY